MEAGEAHFDQLRRRAADQEIEVVGRELRALMTREGTVEAVEASGIG